MKRAKDIDKAGKRQIMVRHIVAWNFGDSFTEEEKKESYQKIKTELEGLKKRISGIIELKVYSSMLPSSNKDIILNSLFESEDALAAYTIHPEHLKVAAFVQSHTQNRVCVDYNE